MRYERPIFIAGILPSCSSLYPVLVLIRRASHILLDVHHIGILAQHHTVGIALVKSFAAYTKHLFFENLRI